MQLEGSIFPLISFKYPSDKFQRIEELLQKLGFLPLKKGEAKSKPYQLLMDSLINGQIVVAQRGVTTNPKTRRCYMQDYAQVSVEEICEACRVKTPKVWLDCPGVLKDAGVRGDVFPLKHKRRHSIR